MTRARGRAPDDVVLWTVLLKEPLDEACAGERDRVRAAADFLDPVIERVAVPRRIADGVRRIVAILPRIASGRAGRFARTELMAPGARRARGRAARRRQGAPRPSRRCARPTCWSAGVRRRRVRRRSTATCAGIASDAAPSKRASQAVPSDGIARTPAPGAAAAHGHEHGPPAGREHAVGGLRVVLRQPRRLRRGLLDVVVEGHELQAGETANPGENDHGEPSLSGRRLQHRVCRYVSARRAHALEPFRPGATRHGVARARASSPGSAMGSEQVRPRQTYATGPALPELALGEHAARLERLADPPGRPRRGRDRAGGRGTPSRASARVPSASRGPTRTTSVEPRTRRSARHTALLMRQRVLLGRGRERSRWRARRPRAMRRIDQRPQAQERASTPPTRRSARRGRTGPSRERGSPRRRRARRRSRRPSGRGNARGWTRRASARARPSAGSPVAS